MTTLAEHSKATTIQRSADNAPPAVPVATRRLLILTHRVPYPPDRGDRIRSYHLIETLSQHFEISVASTSTEPTWFQHHHLLNEMVDRVAIEPISSTYGKIRGLGALLTGRPITPASFYRRSLANTIEQWHHCQPFDAVLTFCTGMIDYARLLMRTDDPSKPRPRHILDLVDVDSAKWASYAAASLGPRRWVYAAEARRLRRIEAAERDTIDAITVVSEPERQTYRQTVGDFENLHVIGNGVDLAYFTPLPDNDAKRIVFVGVLDYKPNADGIEWFVKQVMPILRQRVADVTLEIVGRHPTSRIMDLGRSDGVEVIGSVSDVRSHLGSAGAVIAPLQIARGVQNKVLEAMACARAVVCSPQAAQGINAEDGKHLLVAAEPRQWAQQLEHVLTNAPSRQCLADNARRQVEQHYNWQTQLQPMVDLLMG